MKPTIKATELQEFKLELAFTLLRKVMQELGMETIVSRDKKLRVSEFGVAE